MRTILVQLDTSQFASLFDQIVAYDAGTDVVTGYARVAPGDVRDLVYGAIFTRGPKDLHRTALFIGGDDMDRAEALLDAARQAMFGPMRVSIMLDAKGACTTAAAAVGRIERTIGSLRDARALVVAGTGAVGRRAAGLLAQAGAQVTITSRRGEDAVRVGTAIARRTGHRVETLVIADPWQTRSALAAAEVVLASGPPGVRLVPRELWAEQRSLRVVVDLNAVPPYGIDGVEPHDDGAIRNGVACFGALGVGGFKMKLHKACIARLFERNDLVLDVEAIAEVARELEHARSLAAVAELPTGPGAAVQPS